MAGIIDKAAWKKRFADVNTRSFGVPFPGMNTPAIMRPLPPSKYKLLLATIQDSLEAFSIAALPELILSDGKTIRVKAWEDKDKPAKDDKPAKISPSLRYQTRDGEWKEVPKDTIVKQGNAWTKEPPVKQLFAAWEKLLWEKLVEILQIIFPDDTEKFTRDYIDKNLNFPFVSTLWDLTVELNGLEPVIPFLRSFFLGKEAPKEKKSRLTK